MNITHSPVIYTFIVGGTVGAGKSEFVTRMTKIFSDRTRFPRARFVAVLEPVDVWQRSHLLELFIKSNAAADNKQQLNWGGIFQIETFITRLARWTHVYNTEIEPLLHEPNVDVIFVALERSHFCDKNLFASMLFESGHIKETERKAYEILFQTFKDHMPTTPVQSLIWIKTDFQETLDRKCQRKRIEEAGYNTDYLKQLYDRHTALFKTGSYELEAGKSVPVFEFNGNVDFHVRDEPLLVLAQQLISVASGLGKIVDFKYQDMASLSVPN
jgi:deoxyadenosine/deoxycytidine kinase